MTSHPPARAGLSAAIAAALTLFAASETARADEIFSSGQGAANPDAHMNSDADGQPGPQFVAADFTLAGSTIVRSVSWEGTYSSNTPPASGDRFQVVIYDASGPGGGPGIPVSRTLGLSPVRAATGLVESGSDVYAYAANIAPTPLAAGTYWIQVANDTPDNGVDTWSWTLRFGHPGGGAVDHTSHDDAGGGFGAGGTYAPAPQDFGVTVALDDAPIDVVFASGQGDGVPSAHYNSDANPYPGNAPQFVAMDFTLAGATSIRSVAWEGTYSENTPPAADAFQIVFYDTTGPSGGPGAVVAERLGIDPGRSETPWVEGGDAVHGFAATIDPVTLPAGAYWVSICNDTPTNGNDTWSISTRQSAPGGGANDFISHLGSGNGYGAPGSFDPFQLDAGVAFTLAGGAAPNAAPSADAGADQTLEAGAGCEAEVVLSGAGSSDPDGDDLTFAWSGSFGSATGETLAVTLPLGSHEIELTVDDGNGESDTDTVVVTVADTTPPVFDATSPVTLECTDPEGTPGAVPTPSANDACDGPVAVTSDAPALFPLGDTVVTFSATDAAGNSATATMTVTVADTTPPLFGTTTSVTLECADPAGTPGAVPSPEANDSCDGPVGVSSDAPALFPLGDTVVTFTATDAAGNVATTTATVTVVDTTAPLFGATTPITLECTDPAGTPGAVPTPEANDACDGPVAVTSDAPSLFPHGDTVVTFTATDAAGNVATATTTVTVADTTPPIVGSASADPHSLWPANHKMVAVTITLEAGDACTPVDALTIVAAGTSDQPDDPKGKGKHAGDVNGADGFTSPVDISAAFAFDPSSGAFAATIDLRAEREGGGRVYTVSGVVRDASGNEAPFQVQVFVPQSQGSAHACDDHDCDLHACTSACPDHED